MEKYDSNLFMIGNIPDLQMNISWDFDKNKPTGNLTKNVIIYNEWYNITLKLSSDSVH